MKIEEKRQELKTIYADLETYQTKMEDGTLDQNEGEKATELAKRAEELQADVEQYERVQRHAAKGREAPKPPLPGRGVPDDGEKAREVVATPGELLVASREFAGYRKSGMQGWSGKVDIGNFEGRPVKLRGENAEQYLERKAEALPDLGTDALAPYTRDPELVRFEEPEILNLRDLFGSLPATSDTVHFVRHTATGRNAASQDGKGGTKAYLNVVFAAATTPVETIAVLSKVAEQDIEDAARLTEIVNSEMALDINVETERQLLWGSGNNSELSGLFTEGVPEFDRAAVGDTVLDTIRRMRTDLRVSRVRPSALAIHPLDWEDVELTKADDDHYIWAVVQTTRGPQVWSLAVVEVDSLEDADTGERRMLLGDFRRGATVYDRNQVRMAVGYVDDDFEKNLRTLRAEHRLGFAVKRDHAFSYTQTVAPES